MSYTPTIWANGKTPAINANNLNKIEEELKKLDDIVSVPDITETTETTMPNSYSGRLLVEEIGGVCEQNTTTGKNLLECSILSEKTVNGVTFTPVYENGMLQYIQVNGTATSNAEYGIIGTEDLSNIDIAGCLLSGCPNGGAYNKYSLAYLEWDSAWGALVANYDYGNGVVLERNANMSISAVRIIVSSGYTASNLRFYPMIRLASVADGTYEPYTGGIPSPNPSYPQEIKKTVVSEIKTHGKNFYNPNTHVKSSTTIAIMGGNKADSLDAELIKSGEYTVSYNCDKYVSLFVVDYNKNNVIVNGTVQKSVTFTIPHDTRVNIWLYTSTGVNGIVDIQLEEGTVATEYEPYTESAITLSQPIDLYGTGGVKNVIESGKVKRRFYKFVLDGTQNPTNTQTGTPGGGIEFRFVLPYKSSTENPGYVANALCNISTVVSSDISWAINQDSFAVRNDVLFLRVPSWTDVTDNTTLKAKLKSLYDAGNPVYVVYELAEETTEDLPIADQIALNSLATYDGITYLEFDSEIEPTFKGEYGTSKVGGYTLEGMLAGRNGELYGKDFADRITALEATVVNNI